MGNQLKIWILLCFLGWRNLPRGVLREISIYLHILYSYLPMTWVYVPLEYSTNKTNV